MPRPSEPLLAFLRDAMRRKGLTTSALATRIERDRGELKRSLAGVDPLTVDDLVRISQELALTPAELGLTGAAAELAEEPETSAEPSQPTPPILLRPAGPPVEEMEEPTLGEIPARDVLQLGFKLGVDLFAILETSSLGESGVPDAVLKRFPERLPIQFEARYHRHNKPVFGDETFQCVLSFDRLYTCTFPWEAFREVRFLLPSDTPSTPARPPEPPAPPPPSRPTLRVVK